jgi:4-hydroxy-tetrahydrodipicolinate synthase
MAIKPTRFGLSCAITTPMQDSGAVDLARLAKHARFVLDGGCDSITLFGTTGEGAALGLPVRERMIGAVLGAGVEASSQLYAGIAAASLHEALDQARMAMDVGARGLLVAPPFYFKGVSDDGLFSWFSQFITRLGASARGIILYHIPSVTAVDISVALVDRLKKAFPGVIAGVKDSSCHWPTTEAFLKAHGDLAILVGDERLLARAVREGGEGSICGVANLVPGWLRPLVYEGREDPRINQIVDAIVSYPVIPAVKALVGHLHGDSGFGAMRAPLEALSAGDRTKLFAAFDAIRLTRAA